MSGVVASVCTQPNGTENDVQRISYARSPTASILGNLDDSIKRQLPSGKHSHGSLEMDLNELIKRAFEFKIFSEVDARSYKIFNGFQRDRLANLDVSSLHQWIKKHKKNITWGIRARWTLPYLKFDKKHFVLQLILINEYKEKSHFFVFFSLWAGYIFDSLTPFKDGRNPYSQFFVTFEIKMVDFWQHLCLSGFLPPFYNKTP